jgi:hypothetical protein
MTRTTKAEREAAMRTLAGEQHCAEHDQWFAQGDKCLRCVVQGAPGRLLDMAGAYLAKGTVPDQNELIVAAGATILQFAALAQRPQGVLGISLTKNQRLRRAKPVAPRRRQKRRAPKARRGRR